MAIREQVIALAAMTQAAFQVDQLARTGVLDREASRPCIDSLFKFDAATADDIYGGLANLRIGFATLKVLLQRQLDLPAQHQLRYLTGMMFLQRKLQMNPTMLQVIRSRLEHTARHGQHFTDNADTIISAVGAIYQDTISTFTFRIQVTGEPSHLQQTRNADCIRALLLAGIRSATLWQQSGGRRWLLMFQRNALLRQMAAMTAEFTLN